MSLKTLPLARIREAECIGCTQCIKACPVDAIVGRSHFMHTVIEAECIGCKLCLPPCPVDCIELYTPEPSTSLHPETPAKEKAAHIKKRYNARKQRLQKREQNTPPLSLQTGSIQKTLERLKLKILNPNDPTL